MGITDSEERDTAVLFAVRNGGKEEDKVVTGLIERGVGKEAD